MRILTIHNKYKIRGGEDESSELEDELLLKEGHSVDRHVVDNATIEPHNLIGAAANCVFNWSSYRNIRAMIRRLQPEVVDVHNFFPLISPSVYYACSAENVPVVQTLHNFRIICPGATLYRNGKPCEKCINLPFALPAIQHKCYRSSAMGSLAVATMISTHNAFQTWNQQVTLYVALSEFCRRKFVEAGLPEDRIRVKPNFVYPDPGLGEQNGKFAVFVGRLVPEKGIQCLLRAWKRKKTRLGLKIIGEGPLCDFVREEASANSEVEYLGKQPRAVVNSIIGQARAVVFPSEWYEPFGRVIIESFAKGTPVIAGNLGATNELIDHDRTGWTFAAGDDADLASKIDIMQSLTCEDLKRIGLQGRREYETKYTAEENLKISLSIFESAIARGTKTKSPLPIVAMSRGKASGS